MTIKVCKRVIFIVLKLILARFIIMEGINKSKLMLSLLPVLLIFILVFSTCKNKSGERPGNGYGCN